MQLPRRLVEDPLEMVQSGISSLLEDYLESIVVLQLDGLLLEEIR